MKSKRHTLTVLGMPILGLLGTSLIFGAKPAADIPWRPSTVKQWRNLDLLYGVRPDPDPARFIFSADSIVEGAAARPSLRPPITPPTLSEELMGRMKRECLRYKQSHPNDPSSLAGPLDSIAEAERAHQAERIITRALDRTMDAYLERLARTSRGLARVIDWVDGARLPRVHLGRSNSAKAPGPHDTRAVIVPRRSHDLQMRIGLKIDAHPRVVLRSRFLGVRGRIEVPVLNEPVRYTFRRRLGRNSEASLSGTWGRDDESWTALNLNFSF
jgi:hypothetical protein